MPDPIFADRRLADIYDALDPDRSDLTAYVDIAAERGARSVLDIGCGTGTLACLLAARGHDVVAVDPAEASLEVARRKPHAEAVRWIHGVATDVPPLAVDLAVMTANVAQVFLEYDDWAATLAAIHTALRPGGTLVFETRDPDAQAWNQWNRAHSHRVADIPGVGAVETWVDLLDVADDLVSFRHTFVFASDGAVLTSDSTLRFRSREEVASDLAEAGFGVEDVRGAPGRPGQELVFVASRPA